MPLGIHQIDRCSTIAVVAAEEDKILFPKADSTKGSFGSVVIRLCQTIITVVAQRIPLVQGISERLAQPGFFRQRGAFLHQPVMQISAAAILTVRLPAAHCREAAYFLFYRHQLTDVSGLPRRWPSEYLYRRRGFFDARGPSMQLLLLATSIFALTNLSYPAKASSQYV